MKQFLLLLGLLFCSVELAAQHRADKLLPQIAPDRNAIYLEAGGNGGVGSLNYERRFLLTGDPIAALRVGGFFMPLYYSHVITVPTELTIINGRRNLKFEFGFGLTYFKAITRERPYDGTFVEDMQALLPFLRLGARYQAPGKPFFMRAGFTPYLFQEQHVSSPQTGFMPWGGISVGYSFGKR